MTQPTHTPAPWNSTFTSKSKRGVRAACGFICFMRDVTRFSGQDERYEQELSENQANARLIAAAPELLEALIEIDNAMQDIDGYKGRRGTWEVVQAAIAKARG